MTTTTQPPARSRSPRTAQQGRPAWVSLDPISITRLDYAKHIITVELAASATNSTVVRRALAVYQLHLEDLARPLTPKRYLDTERRALIAANRGDKRSISANTLAALPSSQPVPTLASLLAPRPAPSLPPICEAPWEFCVRSDARALPPPWKE